MLCFQCTQTEQSNYVDVHLTNYQKNKNSCLTQIKYRQVQKRLQTKQNVQILFFSVVVIV